MLVIVLPLAFVCVYFVVLGYGLDWRQAIVGSSLAMGIWLTVGTELLSLFHLFNRDGVVFLWGGLILLCRAVYWRQQQWLPKISLKIPFDNWLLLAGVGVIAAGTGITAVLAPPNTWDSMTYHMSRVMHWIQNDSVAFYPTYIARQLYQPPFAEWVITHLQLLIGGDYFANGVQWLSWVGCLVTTSLISREFEAKQRGQIFCVVVVATINMGILQSSSTQNDVVVSYWISCALYMVIYGVQKGFRWISVIGLGSAIGLAVLTKGTAYVFIAPFLLWVVVYAWRNQRRDIWKYGIVLGCVALALNIGHYSRNLRWFGSPLGSETSFYANQEMSPALWTSVAVRNIALHIAVQPELDLKIGLSQSVNRAVAAIHRVLGLSVDDHRVTLLPEHFFAKSLILHEDQTAAPAHLMLIIAAILLYLASIYSLKRSLTGIYGLAALLSFALFCFLFRWQPWNNRLHLPLFVLLAPFIAVVFERRLPYLIVVVIGFYLLYIATFPTFYNQSRPLLDSDSIRRTDRWTVMFYNRPDLRDSYAEAIEQTHQLGCEAVGLKLGLDIWEYPLWSYAVQQQYALRFTYIESVIKIAAPEFETCAIIASKSPTEVPEPLIEVDNQLYQLIWRDNNLAVYQADLPMSH